MGWGSVSKGKRLACFARYRPHSLALSPSPLLETGSVPPAPPLRISRHGPPKPSVMRTAFSAMWMMLPRGLIDRQLPCTYPAGNLQTRRGCFTGGD